MIKKIIITYILEHTKTDYGNIQIHEKVQKMINDRLYALSKLINNSPIQ
jgi:hypothetical protein